jgi:hypothetical protein
MKVVVYTAIFGYYDELLNPRVIDSDFQYICFTDNVNITSKIWKIIYVNSTELTHDLTNRKYKLLPHLYLDQYDLSIYVDGNIKIIGSLGKLLKKYLTINDLFLAPPHRYRNCVYAEIQSCVESGKISRAKGHSLINFYQGEKFEKNIGLTENNILIRRHKDLKMIRLSEDWWESYLEYRRDQLSLQYVALKWKVNIRVIPENSRGQSNFFFALPHKNDKLKWKFKIILKYIVLVVLKMNFFKKYL